MRKSTQWNIGDTIIFHYPLNSQCASITIVDEACNQAATRGLNESQLNEMQLVIREILRELPSDP